MTQHLDFDESNLRTRLSCLPAKSAAIFAFLCATRLVHTVKDWRSIPDSTKSLLIEAELDMSRALSSDGQLPNSLEERLLDASPTEEEDPSFEGAALEDTVAALVYAIRSLISNSAENAAIAARRVYEAADRYAGRSINEGEYSDSAEAVILSSPVVQRELQRQQRDYKFINDRMQIAELASLGGSDKVFSSCD